MYTKHTWQTDEIITADKLNNLEEGVSSMIPTTTGYLQDGDIFTVQTSSGTSKKMVWREINVPLTFMEEAASVDNISNWPDIDSSINTEDFYNLLNFKFSKLGLIVNVDSDINVAGYIPCTLQFVKDLQMGDITFDNYTIISLRDKSSKDEYNIQVIPTYNKIGIIITNSTITSASLDIGGFLPVEE